MHFHLNYHVLLNANWNIPGLLFGKVFGCLKVRCRHQAVGREYQDVVKCHFFLCWRGVAKSCCELKKSPELSISWGNFLQRQQGDMKRLILRIWDLRGASWLPQWFHNLGPFFLLAWPFCNIWQSSASSLMHFCAVCMKPDLCMFSLPPSSSSFAGISYSAKPVRPNRRHVLLVPFSGLSISVSINLLRSLLSSLHYGLTLSLTSISLSKPPSEDCYPACSPAAHMQLHTTPGCPRLLVKSAITPLEAEPGLGNLSTSLTLNYLAHFQTIPSSINLHFHVAPGCSHCCYSNLAFIPYATITACLSCRLCLPPEAILAPH